MSDYRESLDHEEVDGFTITIFSEPDYDWDWDYLTDDKETIKQLQEGNLEVYGIEVRASKAGINLGSDYLGCVIAESGNAINEFLQNGYYEDMKSNAIKEAQTKIQELTS